MTKEEFAIAYSENITQFRAYAMQLCNCEHNAEDIIGESCVKALTHIDSYIEQGYFVAWFNKIIHNCFINSVRRTKPNQRLDYKQGYTIEPMQDYDNDVMLSTLSDRERTIVVLRDQGYPYSDICKLLGNAPITCRTIYHGAKTKINRRFKRDIHLGAD